MKRPAALSSTPSPLHQVKDFKVEPGRSINFPLAVIVRCRTQYVLRALQQTFRTSRFGQHMSTVRWQDCEYCSKFIRVYNQIVEAYHIANCGFCVSRLTSVMAHVHQNHGEQPQPIGEIDRAINEIMNDDAYPKVAIQLRKKHSDETANG